MLSSGFTAREVKERRMIRLFKEGYEQGGVLSNNDIALLLNVSPSTVSKQVVNRWKGKGGGAHEGNRSLSRAINAQKNHNQDERRRIF